MKISACFQTAGQLLRGWEWNKIAALQVWCPPLLLVPVLAVFQRAGRHVTRRSQITTSSLHQLRDGFVDHAASTAREIAAPRCGATYLVRLRDLATWSRVE